MKFNLYHATSTENAYGIDESRRFHPGKQPDNQYFAGRAIYFSAEEGSTFLHCFNKRAAEVVIRCTVDLGACLTAHKYTVDQQYCWERGYDSVRIKGTDTYAVYDPSRIVIHEFKSVVNGLGWCPSMPALKLKAKPEAKPKVHSQATAKVKAKAKAKANRVKDLSSEAALNVLVAALTQQMQIKKRVEEAHQQLQLHAKQEEEARKQKELDEAREQLQLQLEEEQEARQQRQLQMQREQDSILARCAAAQVNPKAKPKAKPEAKAKMNARAKALEMSLQGELSGHEVLSEATAGASSSKVAGSPCEGFRIGAVQPDPMTRKGDVLEDYELQRILELTRDSDTPRHDPVELNCKAEKTRPLD